MHPAPVGPGGAQSLVATGAFHCRQGEPLHPGVLLAGAHSLYGDVVAKVFDRPRDATWVYPGHGGDTTLGAERPQLAEWRERGW